jgi:hypothetical protein
MLTNLFNRTNSAKLKILDLFEEKRIKLKNLNLRKGNQESIFKKENL